MLTHGVLAHPPQTEWVSVLHILTGLPDPVPADAVLRIKRVGSLVLCQARLPQVPHQQRALPAGFASDQTFAVDSALLRGAAAVGYLTPSWGNLIIGVGSAGMCSGSTWWVTSQPWPAAHPPL